MWKDRARTGDLVVANQISLVLILQIHV